MNAGVGGLFLAGLCSASEDPSFIFGNRDGYAHDKAIGLAIGVGVSAVVDEDGAAAMDAANDGPEVLLMAAEAVRSPHNHVFWSALESAYHFLQTRAACVRAGVCVRVQIYCGLASLGAESEFFSLSL